MADAQEQQAAAAAGAAGGGGVGAAEAVSKTDLEKTSADYYQSSYSHFGIHEEMLKDEVRTRSYMDSIMRNKHLFKDKVVMDVGCGTGILSLFAAKAGARLVIGIDAADIIDQAREIVEINGFSDKVKLVKEKVEDIAELPEGVEKVDIIISEWMGYFLLYESMLDTVLYARDRWLTEGGLLFPDKATMYVCGIEDADYKAEKINFWDNVYGFNMTPIKRLALLEPLVDNVDRDLVLSNHATLASFDLSTVTKDELAFDEEFSITFDRTDTCHALVVWFDVEFSACHKPIVMSTSPCEPLTHWKQTVFYLGDELPVQEGDELKGRISSARNAKNHRDLDINVSYDFEGAAAAAKRSQLYRLR